MNQERFTKAVPSDVHELIAAGGQFLSITLNAFALIPHAGAVLSILGKASSSVSVVAGANVVELAKNYAGTPLQRFELAKR